MTARTESMRTFTLNGGPIEIRRDEATDRICIVFESKEMAVRLFRTMERGEAEAFLEHVARQLKAGAQ